MMFILEIDREDSKKVNEAVCLHNWDYDSFLTKEKVESTLRLFGIPVQEHKPESEENLATEYANINFQHCTYHYTDDKRLTDFDAIKKAYLAGYRERNK